MKLVRVSKGERCPTCGAPVKSIFDHLGEDCPPKPEGGYPAETYAAVRGEKET